MMSWQDKLKTLRGALGMTRGELAEALGISVSALGRWERGEVTPRGRALAALTAFARERGAPLIPPAETQAASSQAKTPQISQSNQSNQSSADLHGNVPMIGRMIDDAEFPLYICDAETDELLYVNREAEKLIGCPIGELRDRACYRAVMRVGVPCAFCQHARASEDGAVSVSLPFAVNGAMYRVRGGNIEWNGRGAHVRYLVREDSSSQLRAIIENFVGGVSVALYGKDGGVRPGYANDGYYQLFGYTKEQFVAELASPHDVILEEDTAFVRETIMRVKDERRPATFRYRAKKRDGSVIYVQCSSSIAEIESLGGTVMISVLSDVTEPVEAETAIREQRDQIGNMLNTTPGGIAVIEVDDRDIPGTMRTVYYNDSFYSYSGYDRKEYQALLQGNEMHFVFEEDAPVLLGATERICAGEIGGKAESTVRCHTKDGGYRWLMLTGQLMKRREHLCTVNIVLIDITKRKEAEDGQRISEEMLRVAAETDMRSIIIYNIKNNTCRVESRHLYAAKYGEIFHHIPDSLIDGGIVAPESSDELRALIDRVRAGKRRTSASLLLRAGEKEYQWFECNAATVSDADGHPDRAVLVFHNITEQRVKEAVFKKWQQSIVSRPPDTFTLFRCNLSRNTELDERDGDLIPVRFDSPAASFNDRTRQYADQYVYAGDRQAYKAMLDADTLLGMFYRGEHTTAMEYREMLEGGGLAWRRLTVEMVEYLHSTDVQAFLMYEDIDEKKTAELIKKEMSETDPLTGALNRVAFSVKTDAMIADSTGGQHALFMMDIDGFKLLNDTFGHAAGDQALMDVTAVLRSMIREGDLVCRLGGDEFMIWLRDVPYDAFIDKMAQQMGEQVRKAFSREVQISASIGIAVYPRDGANFDELYRRADSALYKVKQAGKDSYAFYSVVGGDKTEGSADMTRAIKAPPAAARRRMLIVDDETASRELLRKLFQDEYQIEIAKNGADAMIRLRHFGTAISVVLLDLVMPGIDGFEVLKRIQNNIDLRAIPVIVVSVNAEHQSLLHAVEYGAADYVTKPVDAELIRLRVKSAVSKAENERLRAQNSYLQLQRDEELKYHTVLESTGTVVIEYNWRNHVFIYDDTISDYIAGNFNHRGLWTVLLADMVADTVDVKSLQEMMMSLANSRERCKCSRLVMLKTPQKERRWFRINFYKREDEFGLAEKIIITFNDVHDEVLANEQLKFRATRDELTGLYNRAGFIERAAELVAAHEPGYYMMACVDIEKFKVINDQYGTEKGDMVLRRFACVLAKLLVGQEGACCRVMADNFALLYPKRLLVTADVEKSHDEAATLDGSLPPLKFCIGRCAVDDLSLQISAIYDRAAIAKDTVKGRYDAYVATYDESMRASLLRQQEITGQMNTALESGQFEVWLQPQFNHATGMLSGAEALARWRHPKEGLISPGEFIPIFERNGFVYELDKFVWEQTCILLRRWLDQGFNPVPVSVNISRHDVFKDDLIPVIKALIEKYNLPADLLRLEITESAFAESADQIIRVVKEFVALGFIVEIDDFGSGYSSLNTLKDVPAQVLKMDMRFLENDSNAQRGGSIIESVARMARWLGMSVIAEGVETLEQADYLKSIGCEYVQGFLYSRPEQVADYEKYFAEGKLESRFARLKTVETWNNNAFWNPESMETLIFNSYVGGACIFEYLDGNAEILRYNEDFAEIFAKSFGRGYLTMHRDLFGKMDDENVASIRKSIESVVRTKKEAAFECRYLIDNDLLYLRMTVRQIAQAGERCLFYCVADDMTSQRVAERAEREAMLAPLRRDLSRDIERGKDAVRRLFNPEEGGGEFGLEWLTENIPAGLATYACGDGQIRQIYRNDGFCALFGMTASEYEESAEDDPMALVFDEDKPVLAENYHALMKTGVPMDCVYRIHVKDGGFKWIQHRAAIASRYHATVLVNAALLDITERQEENERLSMAEEQYRLATKHSGATTCRYDIASRTLAIASDTAKRLELPEIMENIPYDTVLKGRVSSDTAKSYIEFYEGIMRGEKESAVVFQKLFPSGWRWLNAHGTTMFSGDGKPVSAVISYTDVTEQQEKEAVFRRWQQRLKEKGADAYTLYRCNLNKDRSYDTAEGALLPFAAQDDDGMLFNDITKAFAAKCVFPDDRLKYIECVNSDRLLASYHRGRRADELLFRCKVADGAFHWLRLSVEMVEYPNSTDVEAYLMYEDVNDETLKDLRTRRESETDPLTGLLNRAAFIEKFDQMLAGRAENALTALFMLDMDGFKLINDSFGHAAGDRVLIDAGNAIRSILRDRDLVCRLGGDEFLVGLSDMPDRSAVIAKAKQLCRLTHKAFNLDVRMSISLGISVSPNDGSDFDELYRKADKALYYVKEHGKDNCAFYSDDMKESFGEHEERAAQPAAMNGAKRKMLIVEDNPASQALLKNIFVNDFEIETTENGVDALTYLRRNAASVHIVLLDLMLPEMDGMTVLEKMKDSAELQTVPVIVVSGIDDRDTNLRAVEYGAADFVTKPVDADLLRVRVASAIAKAENERLRLQNRTLKAQHYESDRIRAILEADGTVIADYDHFSHAFQYEPAMTRYLAGRFDDRSLWDILTRDNILGEGDARTLREMIEPCGNDAPPRPAKALLRLKTASGEIHPFRVKAIPDVDTLSEGKHTLVVFTDLTMFGIK